MPPIYQGCGPKVLALVQQQIEQDEGHGNTAYVRGFRTSQAYPALKTLEIQWRSGVIHRDNFPFH